MTPGGSHAGRDWLTPNSESKELPLLIHPIQTLGCLTNIDLYSQRETFSSQPAGNLEKCLIFTQGTPGWCWGLKLAMMKGICSLSHAPRDLLASKAFSWLEWHVCFSGTLLDESGWSKRTETQDKAGHFWVPVDCELFQPPGFRVRGWCYSQVTFEEGIKERVFGQRAVWSKGQGNHAGQDETRVITSFFALSVPWGFYTWEQVHGDNQGIGGAPGTWCSWW